MESSRVFVRGLPPTVNGESLSLTHAAFSASLRVFTDIVRPFLETDLRKHFSLKGHVSDIKCFPKRRIGYVGFKTPQEAAEAVKYFNRSFIRMSKINVELARPVRSHLIIVNMPTWLTFAVDSGSLSLQNRIF